MVLSIRQLNLTSNQDYLTSLIASLRTLTNASQAIQAVARAQQQQQGGNASAALGGGGSGGAVAQALGVVEEVASALASTRAQLPALAGTIRSYANATAAAAGERLVMPGGAQPCQAITHLLRADAQRRKPVEERLPCTARAGAIKSMLLFVDGLLLGKGVDVRSDAPLAVLYRRLQSVAGLVSDEQRLGGVADVLDSLQVRAEDAVSRHPGGAAALFSKPAVTGVPQGVWARVGRRGHRAGGPAGLFLACRGSWRTPTGSARCGRRWSKSCRRSPRCRPPRATSRTSPTSGAPAREGLASPPS